MTFCSWLSFSFWQTNENLIRIGVVASKDAQQVVNVVHNAGLAKLVARLKPLIVVKG